MSANKKTVSEYQQEARAKLISTAKGEKTKYDNLVEKAKEAKVKVENAEGKDIEAAKKAFETAKENASVAFKKYLESRAKASRFVSVEDASVSVEKPENFTPKNEEKMFYHIELDQPNFDKKTGKKLSKAFVQIFDIPAFKSFAANQNTLGFTVQVLWNPEVYLSL